MSIYLSFKSFITSLNKLYYSFQSSVGRLSIYNYFGDTGKNRQRGEVMKTLSIIWGCIKNFMQPRNNIINKTYYKLV